ncbi:uncharacterized protein A1O9_06906 [Exophiala aquamarina CBS 119918]|uniref:Alpha-L-rhamnosidase six-hairpin glycosidase domain-containing protein n=1 Tax=Exophiala aquamarina CBS 119918 TaxID=1182545 RepID=A0A072PA35_9EURO|nr:uncharacterized protein A1O9_06906 [Exophiala aquamarina CBS 119918]KEF56716.1 hypothetical protein A1O9_06906 [Exophiala aquamarina CBS 119918]
MLLLLLALSVLLGATAAAQVPYAEYVLTPRSRILRPAEVYNVNSTVGSTEDLTSDRAARTTFTGPSAVTYDFEKNVAGLVAFNVSEVAGSCAYIADAGIDESLWLAVEANGHYAAGKQYQRGGFRYLNVYHNSTGNVTLSDLTVYYTAIPHYTEDQLATGVQTGYFHCKDDQISRVWYAGAYTNELCTIDPTAGNSLIHLGEIGSNSNVTAPLTWYNNHTIANGTAALVDGAKRDRLNASGALPYAGRPFRNKLPIWSFTYHLQSLNDIYMKALDFSLSFIDDSGMANVTTAADWLRFGMGGHNIEANSILYHNLNLATSLAAHLNDTSTFVQSWPDIAEELKSSANQHLWDPELNLYRDNDTLPFTDLHPQDGNAWAIISNLTSSSARAVNVSRALQARWGPYGAPAPEAGETVSPFVSGFELQAHYIAGRLEASVDLTKLMWGDFMLDDPRMTNSTFIEGYSTNGDLHYAPYENDPRLSHAHGWATGPTSTLTFFAAGLQVTSAAGKTWLVAPQLGGLHSVEAGYQTNVGSFASRAIAMPHGGLNVTFNTPVATSGKAQLRYSGLLGRLTVPRDSTGHYTKRQTSEEEMATKVVTVDDLPGGNYSVILEVGA